MTEKYIIRGPQPLVPLPSITVGEVVFESLKENIGKPDALVRKCKFKYLDKSVKINCQGDIYKWCPTIFGLG